MIDFSDIDYNCLKTWNLIGLGRTKGVFQLETHLGQSWAKRLKPSNLEELAALVALLRPGCLKAIVDGKSLTQHYVDRKHKKDEITYIHPSLEEVLKPTQGILIFQEQSLKIAQLLAGFNLQKADSLRKAIGKKQAGLMAEVKKSFLEGAESKKIVTKEVAEEIFGIIEKSNRYSFNKSHAISYAICAYWSAYAKAHHKLEFYCSYLRYAREKINPQKEVRELVSDAKLEDISIYPPSLNKLSTQFQINDDNIYFGIRDLKSVGTSHAAKLLSILESLPELSKKSVDELSWYEFLVYVSDKINKRVIESLISVGALSCTNPELSRNNMIYEFNIWNQLTKKEKEWCVNNINVSDKLVDLLTALSPTKSNGGGTFNAGRSETVKDLILSLKSPPYALDDTPEWIVQTETEILGVPLTYMAVDSCDIGGANTSCREFTDGKMGKMILAVEIKSAREWTIKQGAQQGKKMAFLSVEDSTCPLDSVIIFSEEWEKYRATLFEGNTVLLFGERSRKKDSFIVQKISQI